MIKELDNFLNNITMYRLTLYGLICLSLLSVLFGFLDLLPYSGISLIISLSTFVLLSWAANTIFAQVYKAPANTESTYITALILFLIISPPSNLYQASIVFWTAVIACASKYIIAAGNKHVFNPVAFSIFIISATLGYGVSWWIGTSAMFPALLIFGLMITRKLRRTDMVTTFFLTALSVTFLFTLVDGINSIGSLQRTIFSSSLAFVGFIMLTEPQTTPPDRKTRIIYGALVGFLFSPQIHYSGFYSTPEFALLIGNLYSYYVRFNKRLTLKLVAKKELSRGIYNFTFSADIKPDFLPGQYMEWTLPHNSPDSRGMRRFFSIASSPTEDKLAIGVKFSTPGSSFKKQLLSLKNGDLIYSDQLAGDFTLKNNFNKKLVFIAGGIGITPFRSMLRYITDRGKTVDAVLFYACSKPGEFVYKDVIDEACFKWGIKAVYIITKKENAPVGWTGESGYITKEMLASDASDFLERIFYISGPNSMVESYKKLVKTLGVPGKNIITDYFPGY